MAWEIRSSQPYYYTKQRQGGRVVSRYVGAGLAGQCAALLAEAQRERQDALATQRARGVALDSILSAAGTHCRDLAALLLLASGHHQHKGTWRKRRGGTMAPQPNTDDMLPLLDPGDMSPEALRAILRRCDRIDATPDDVAALRALLPHYPGLVHVGDLLRQASDQLVNGEALAQATGITRETIRAWFEQRRTELGYTEASALERPLIEHLVLCEQRVGLVETIYSLRMRDVTFEEGQYWEKRLEATQRRYLRAVETLARVRRLALPVLIQNNAAVQQVNITGGGDGR